MFAMFLNFDSGAGTYRMILSGGHLLSNPATAYALATTTLSHPGGATALLAGQTQTLFASAFSGTQAQYFNGVKGMIWASVGTLDFSVSGNRDLFFNETTQLPVDLGDAAGVVGGLSPYLYLPGDAAELWMGGQDRNAWNATRGGCNVQNHGSGGDLFSFAWHPTGRMTTL